MLKQALLLTLMAGSAASAHEFWIEPLDYTINSQQSLRAEVRSGEFFSGEVFPYMPERIIKTELINQDDRRLISGLPGTMPALQEKVSQGIQIVTYQSTPSVLTHRDYSSFQQFLSEDGLQWVDSAHRERRLPPTGFQEKFTRYAKTLISVDGVPGNDQAIGLPYEIVVMSPLYTPDEPQDIDIQLLAEGQPVNDVQITVFKKPVGSSRAGSPIKLRTDHQGQISFTAAKGTEYLASAVIMTEEQKIPWHSHWTSVTFSTP